MFVSSFVDADNYTFFLIGSTTIQEADIPVDRHPPNVSLHGAWAQIGV